MAIGSSRRGEPPAGLPGGRAVNCQDDNCQRGGRDALPGASRVSDGEECCGFKSNRTPIPISCGQDLGNCRTVAPSEISG